MDQRFKRIREEIARKHKFVVSDDDPVLIVITICDAFLEESEQMIERLHEEHLEKLEDVIASKEEKNNRYKLVIAALGGVALGIFITLFIT